MNFIATFSDSGTQLSKIINTTSWSTCLAYCEGTGFDITSIMKLPSTTSVIIKDSGTDNCYNVFLKSNGLGTNTVGYVFAADFNSLEAWLAEQTDVSVVNIQLQPKSYVTV